MLSEQPVEEGPTIHMVKFRDARNTANSPSHPSADLAPVALRHHIGRCLPQALALVRKHEAFEVADVLERPFPAKVFQLKRTF